MVGDLLELNSLGIIVLDLVATDPGVYKLSVASFVLILKISSVDRCLLPIFLKYLCLSLLTTLFEDFMLLGVAFEADLK